MRSPSEPRAKVAPTKRERSANEAGEPAQKGEAAAVVSSGLRATRRGGGRARGRAGTEMRGKVGAISMSFALHRTRWIDSADREALSSLAVTKARSALHASVPPEELSAPRHVEVGACHSRYETACSSWWARPAGRRDAPISHFFSASRYTGPRTRLRRHSFTSQVAVAVSAVSRRFSQGKSTLDRSTRV
jgi:hypothetical protein